MSLFHDAAQDGDLKLLRKASKRDVARLDQDGMSPMHWVGWSGNVDAAKILLQKGANVETADNNGNCVLHVAAQYGNVKLLRYLVEEAGASVWALNDDGKTACEVAAETEQSTAFRYLDALQLRLRVDDPDKADKSRQRARKAWAKRADRRDKTAGREQGAEKVVAKLRKRQSSESILPLNPTKTGVPPSAAAPPPTSRTRQMSQILPRQTEPEVSLVASGRERAFSDPTQDLHTLDRRDHPDITENDDSEADGVFQPDPRPKASHGTHKASSKPMLSTKSESLEGKPSSRRSNQLPSTSFENASAAQAMARYQGSNLRSRFSLRPSMSSGAMTSSTSGVGTDLSGMSSLDNSMGSASGSRTAMAIARIKGLGGLNALTHSATPADKARKASAPVITASAELEPVTVSSSFQRYRVHSDSTAMGPSTSAATLKQKPQVSRKNSAASTAGAMRRTSSSASANSAKSSRSLPAQLASRQQSRRPSVPSPTGKGAKPEESIGEDLEETSLTPMATFLHMIDLDDHLSLLEEEQMDLDSLMLCSDMDLKDLDMALGPRRKILAAVQKRKATLSSAERRTLQDSEV
eukprot:scpid49250/ scgid15253/ Usher syndrome type-1G protein homolog; Jackson shaker protein; Scaffold protein containing ankyrin repeats and SAM domain